MKEKYIRPQIVNSNAAENSNGVFPAKVIFLMPLAIRASAIPSHKLENLPKRKD